MPCKVCYDTYLSKTFLDKQVILKKSKKKIQEFERENIVD